MTFRGQISWALLTFLLLAFGTKAQDLAFDETGPTAPEAVSVGTMSEDFLLPTYTLPVSPVSVSAEPVLSDVQVVPENIDILTEIFGAGAMTLNTASSVQTSAVPQMASTPGTTKTFTPTKQGKVNTASGLLTPLADLPDPIVNEDEEVPPYTPFVQYGDYANQALGAMRNKTPLKFTMPREIRVSFYPGQAVFSAQVLKWVKAFSLKALSDPRYQIEIRASSVNWPLQSKRVALLVQTIMEQGVSRHQIKVYQSERDENSVMMGCVMQAQTDASSSDQKKGNKQKTLTW